MIKKHKFKKLKTERMVLKPVVATYSFANKLFKTLSTNKDFYKYLSWAFYFKNPEQLFAFLKGAENCWKDLSRATYSMHIRKDNNFVGILGVFNIDWFEEICEIGYWLNPQYKNQGFMSEAVKTVSKNFFNMGFKRIVIKANPKNIASCKVAEKCGFKREGILRSYDFLPTLNKREDIALYAKIKEK